MVTAESIETGFDRLFRVLSSERFLKMQGLGNEDPFFIETVHPCDASRIPQFVEKLLIRLQHSGVRPMSIDLFDLALEMLRCRNLLDRLVEEEAHISKDDLLELLQNVLDPTKHLVPAMEQKLQASEPQILFITGVGEVYPYIRTHNVLTNLHRVAKRYPTVMFFPGEYIHSSEGGTSLRLFGRLPGDRYYRAFNLRDYTFDGKDDHEAL